MINPKTFDFLRQLIKNNDRDWFMGNKELHNEARENVIEFAAAVVKLASAFDPVIDTERDPKKWVQRIYRDIRFSKDKTPYKNHFGIGIAAVESKKSDNIGYYIHLQPDNNSFIAGGYWQPGSADLKAIRQEIDYNATELKGIIDAPGFKKLFGEFRDQESLKTIPRDYAADHENIALLKLKSFTACHEIADKELLKPDASKYVADVMHEIYPLNVFLNNAIV
jgi:uncharacterized protein (TIGR02453 family)